MPVVTYTCTLTSAADTRDYKLNRAGTKMFSRAWEGEAKGRTGKRESVEAMPLAAVVIQACYYLTDPS